MKKNILAILFAILIVAGLVQCGSEDPTTIPNVTGQTVYEAIQTLDNAGYHQHTVQYPDGTTAFGNGPVTGQTPKAGSKQDTSTKITLTIQDPNMEARKTEEKARKEKEHLKQVANEIKGKNAVEALDRLAAEHMTGTISYKTGLTEPDFEQHIREFDAAGVPWIVLDATPRQDGNNGRIDITVDTKAHAEKANAEKAQSDRLEGKLDQGTALTACKNYGRMQYPAGFKMHTFTGLQTPVPADDNTWSFHVTVDVTNMYGTQLHDLTCECQVTGTTTNPQITEFNIH